MQNKKQYNKVKSAVRSAIRKEFTRSDHYKEFLKLNRVEWYKGKRLRVSYKCADCSELHSGGNINVDHIIPIGSGVYNGLGDAERFYTLVFCSYDNLQVLCKDCHKVKTKLENKSKSFHNAEF